MRSRLGGCAKRLLSTQPNFETQKCAIEEIIAGSGDDFPYLTLYYSNSTASSTTSRDSGVMKSKEPEICAITLLKDLESMYQLL